MAARAKLSLFKWKDVSTDTHKIAEVSMLNGLKIYISIPHHVDFRTEDLYLFEVTFADEQVGGYLDDCDTYIDELREDWSSIMPFEKIEYYLKKLSRWTS